MCAAAGLREQRAQQSGGRQEKNKSAPTGMSFSHLWFGSASVGLRAHNPARLRYCLSWLETFVVSFSLILKLALAMLALFRLSQGRFLCGRNRCRTNFRLYIWSTT